MELIFSGWIFKCLEQHIKEIFFISVVSLLKSNNLHCCKGSRTESRSAEAGLSEMSLLQPENKPAWINITTGEFGFP